MVRCVTRAHPGVGRASTREPLGGAGVPDLAGYAALGLDEDDSPQRDDGGSAWA